MEPLQKELIKLIVETCNVTAQVPETLPADASLFGPDSVFGLDSLDAVEVAVAIQQRYGLRITDRNIFRTRSPPTSANISKPPFTAARKNITPR